MLSLFCTAFPFKVLIQSTKAEGDEPTFDQGPSQFRLARAYPDPQW